ncbi:hypothetical protein DNF23_10495 [Pseudomonas syringae pv. pisi]
MRWHAFRDAPRHRSAPRRTFKSGRSVRNDNRLGERTDPQPGLVAGATEIKFQWRQKKAATSR